MFNCCTKSSRTADNATMSPVQALQIHQQGAIFFHFKVSISIRGYDYTDTNKDQNTTAHLRSILKSNKKFS